MERTSALHVFDESGKSQFIGQLDSEDFQGRLDGTSVSAASDHHHVYYGLSDVGTDDGRIAHLSPVGERIELVLLDFDLNSRIVDRVHLF